MLEVARPDTGGEGMIEASGEASARPQPAPWALRAAPGSPPAYFVTEPDEGTVRVVEGEHARKAVLAGSVGGPVVRNVTMAVACFAGAVAPVFLRSAEPSFAVGLAFGLSMLVGAGLLRARLWSAYGRQEWRAGPGYLVCRSSWAFSPHVSTRRYRDGYFLLWQISSTPDTWDLVLRHGGLRYCVICRMKSREQPPQELRRLGQLLAERTGWSFVEAVPLSVR